MCVWRGGGGSFTFLLVSKLTKISRINPDPKRYTRLCLTAKLSECQFKRECVAKDRPKSMSIVLEIYSTFQAARNLRCDIQSTLVKTELKPRFPRSTGNVMRCQRYRCGCKTLSDI